MGAVRLTQDGRAPPGTTCDSWAEEWAVDAYLIGDLTGRGPQKQLLVYKLVPSHRGQGETKARGRRSQMGRWQE